MCKCLCMCVCTLVLKVPIVKFTDCETAIKIDVGFSASISTGIQSVHFIKVIDYTSRSLSVSLLLLSPIGSPLPLH